MLLKEESMVTLKLLCLMPISLRETVLRIQSMKLKDQ